MNFDKLLYEKEFNKWVRFFTDYTVPELVQTASKEFESYINSPNFIASETEEEIRETILASMMATIKGSIEQEKNTGIEVFINVHYQTKPNDWASKKKKECKDAWDRDKEHAIANFYMKADKNELGEYYNVTPLDYREYKDKDKKIKNGNWKKEFNHTMVRNISGLVIFTNDIKENSTFKPNMIKKFESALFGEISDNTVKREYDDDTGNWKGFLDVKTNEWYKTYMDIQRDANTGNPILKNGCMQLVPTGKTMFDTKFTGLNNKISSSQYIVNWYKDRIFEIEDLPSILKDAFGDLNENSSEKDWRDNKAWLNKVNPPTARGSNKIFIFKVSIITMKYIGKIDTWIIDVLGSKSFNDDGSPYPNTQSWWNPNLIDVSFWVGTVGYIIANIRQDKRKENDKFTTEWDSKISLNPVGFLPIKVVSKNVGKATQQNKKVNGNVKPDSINATKVKPETFDF